MFINVPYFRYRKDGSIHQPVLSETFNEAMHKTKSYVLSKNGPCVVSVCFHGGRPNHACRHDADDDTDDDTDDDADDTDVVKVKACCGARIIDSLDGNTSIGIYDAICEVVQDNGYCCYSVIIYEI